VGLPFEPECLECMKQRFTKALESVYDQESIAAGKGPRPGQYRVHVFDFQDGYRLIVSREYSKDGGTSLHFSMSTMNEVPPFREFLFILLERVKGLYGGPMAGQLQLAMKNGVLHVVRPEGQLVPQSDPRLN